MENPSEYITLRVASRISGYNPDYLSSLIRTGKLKGRKVGKSWMTTARNVEDLLRQVGSPVPRRMPFAVRFALFIGGISIVCALVLAMVYFTIYQTGYQQAEAKSNDGTVSTQMDQSPINY
jgi:hypothetical protein